MCCFALRINASIQKLKSRFVGEEEHRVRM